MPGRKSNVSTAPAAPEDVNESTSAKQSKERERDGLSVEDLSLPKSMIARLAKGVLPANTQIQKDALLALHKSATVFVSYIASNSNDNAQASGKKTISPQDVLAALKDAELEMFLPRLEAELKKYNDTQCDKRNTYRRKVKEEKAAAATKDGEGQGGPDEGDTTLATNGTDTSHVNNGDAERPAKKLKAENGSAVEPDAEVVEGSDGEEPDPEDTDEDDAGEDGSGDDHEEEEEEEGEEDGPDETMEDALEESHNRSEVDEALDESDPDD